MKADGEEKKQISGGERGRQSTRKQINQEYIISAGSGAREVIQPRDESGSPWWVKGCDWSSWEGHQAHIM